MADNDVGIGSFMQNQFNPVAMNPNASPLTAAAATPAPVATPGATFNAATGPNLTAAPSNYVTPPQLGTPSTPASGSFTQGAALPNITTTQQQATAAPAWYMDYLNNLAGTSTQAGANAQYIGAQPLQQQAFNQTAANVGNYQPNLASANALTMNAATTGAPDIAAGYMNPYLRNVVDEAGRLGLQNIRNTISPQATAGAVGSGQFGSTRGANVLGQNVTNALQTLGGQQQGLLAAGYQNALTTAQADLQRQMMGGSQMGALGTTTQQLGMGDVNALSTMGGQQQQMAQNQQLFPLQVAAQQAALMKGFTIPTSVSSTYTGPIPGAYQTSPLMQLGSLGSGIAGLFQTPTSGGASTITNIGDWLSKTFGSGGGGGGSGTFDPSKATDISQISPGD
jgi:hypothetical protein